MKGDRSLIYESVVDSIKAKLLQGELKPGDRLPTISDHAQRLNVGQASVREAYRVLESFGILTVAQGRGTHVNASLTSRDEIARRFQMVGQPSRIHLLEARKLLEPGVAALAAVRATEAEAEAILDAAEAEDAARPKEDEWAEMNLRFHNLIVAAAHNPVLAQMLTTVQELIRHSEPRAARLATVREKGRHYHKLIAMAIHDRSSKAARALMHQHIEDVEEELQHDWQRQ